MSDWTTIAILGVAHSHVEHLAAVAKALLGTRLVAWDADASRLKEAAGRMGVEAVDSLASVWSLQPRLALVGAVPSERATLVERAVGAGAAVMTDKPLALTLDDLDRVRIAVERHGRPVMIFWPYRAYPHVLAAKRAIDSGRIGEVVRVLCSGPHKLNPDRRPDWHWTRSGNGTPIIDVGSHHADLCCWLAGSEPCRVTASRAKLTHAEHPEFFDFEHALVEFESGARGYIEVDWLEPASSRTFGDTRVWVLGTDGKIEIRLGDEVSALIHDRHHAAEPLPLPDADAVDDWLARHMQRLVEGEMGDVTQAEVWRACELTLAAAASADAAGEWTVINQGVSS